MNVDLFQVTCYKKLDLDDQTYKNYYLETQFTTDNGQITWTSIWHKFEKALDLWSILTAPVFIFLDSIIRKQAIKLEEKKRKKN